MDDLRNAALTLETGLYTPEILPGPQITKALPILFSGIPVIETGFWTSSD
jgi:hypothetical protein